MNAGPSCLQVLSILIEYKANPDLVDTQGRTALMYAARAGQAAALELLLRCHTRSNIRDRVSKEKE
jgi:ankyrin repeat protein